MEIVDMRVIKWERERLKWPHIREKWRERERATYNTCCKYELSQVVKESRAIDVVEENLWLSYLCWYNFLGKKKKRNYDFFFLNNLFVEYFVHLLLFCLILLLFGLYLLLFGPIFIVVILTFNLLFKGLRIITCLVG